MTNHGSWQSSHRSIALRHERHPCLEGYDRSPTCFGHDLRHQVLRQLRRSLIHAHCVTYAFLAASSERDPQRHGSAVATALGSMPRACKDHRNGETCPLGADFGTRASSCVTMLLYVPQKHSNAVNADPVLLLGSKGKNTCVEQWGAVAGSRRLLGRDGGRACTKCGCKYYSDQWGSPHCCTPDVKHDTTNRHLSSSSSSGLPASMERKMSGYGG